MSEQQERRLCARHDAFLIDNGDSEKYCSAARIIQTCEFVTVLVQEVTDDSD